jgi:hypothetical protein
VKNFLFFLLLSSTACQTMKPTCDDTKRAADVAAAKMANVLNCRKPEAISADLQGQIEKAQLCENREQGALGEAICRPVSTYVVSQLVKKLPAKWECEGGDAAEMTVNTLYAACVQGAVL